MNTPELDIIRIIKETRETKQRKLAELSGHSLGIVNRSLKNLINNEWLDSNEKLTTAALFHISVHSPKRAVILAAGVGMRMLPVNNVAPKAFLKIHGEPLIERLIKQLHEIGIPEIHVVVGFMKEQFEYLIDKFNVHLIVNPLYAVKNNLHSLSLASEYLENSYILPCDIWCASNPFRKHELYSWYMFSEQQDEKSSYRINRQQKLVKTNGKRPGNTMIGIAYLTGPISLNVKRNLLLMDSDRDHDECFWEEALFNETDYEIPARVVPANQIIEINTFEHLRDLDSSSENTKSEAIDTISKVFSVSKNKITDISVLKKGMTNRSFLFSCQGERYVMRIPGKGTDKLINRREEYEVYNKIKNLNLCDEIKYIDRNNGFKITKYLSDSRCCDPFCLEDVKKCITVLRRFHELKLSVNHKFDIFEKLEFYESLWEGKPSAYIDYAETKSNVLSLKKLLARIPCKLSLTHIDAVPGNFMFYKEKDGSESIRLIDWEYAGMQDPHVDIAMFCIYSLYDRKHINRFIDCYFKSSCPENIRTKIYAYISICGLLWSNWCEFKRYQGVEFGEYSLYQYRYAKEYYRIVSERLRKHGAALNV